MENYSSILEKEDKILSEIIEKQKEFRQAINDKNWSNLMECIDDLNALEEEFSSIDDRRARDRYAEKDLNVEEYYLLSNIRGKLVKSRAETKALQEYITITRGFVQSILDDALPQSRAKLYSRKGYVVNPQPASVVLNTLS